MVKKQSKIFPFKVRYRGSWGLLLLLNEVLWSLNLSVQTYTVQSKMKSESKLLCCLFVLFLLLLPGIRSESEENVLLLLWHLTCYQSGVVIVISVFFPPCQHERCNRSHWQLTLGKYSSASIYLLAGDLKLSTRTTPNKCCLLALDLI